ncbi:hypothetical protein I3J09_02130 [Streptomyces clavuligerus]|uniref:hypothetical protein n=1 Tax=Streptomyces clavuligerus TaxID=1901 RepID=UPI000810DD23|nr:hypothetical protein [Streptomyces clavuligerus]ANW17102.1 hypothetical protein BB341_02140 [Streptomyces clavuligerus]AXU11640.1 hypothetical protein D1794_02245 [Streptomyces clavuligerus]MBY6301477.1 hypothetical protein [Streptomyces clavuligerus]QPL61761.1 hypothetical protein I3J04_02115 [Streptomyces clavuligerus]QPL67794.1 hypothetical protein I3J05_02130 [Streptomyces clavuligerus]
MVSSAEDSPERDPEHLDNGEMRMLLRAAREVAELVGRNRDQLAGARARTIGTHARAEQAVQSLARFEATASLRMARAAQEEVDVRHAEDGAYDRRRRELWIRVLRWPVIVAMALFDAWYFMQVFRYLTSSEEKVSPIDQVVSFLPGAVLALALMLSGHAVAAPLYRLRERLHGLRERRFGLALSVSLVAPALYLGAVLITVAVWALLRARDTGLDTSEVEGSRYEPGWVALLMLVLALTAVAIKVIAHNPYADSAGEARRALLRSRLAYAMLVRRVGDALRDHERAWSDLCALRDELASHVRLESMRVWEAAILTARMVHGQAGHLPPEPQALPGAEDGAGPVGVAPLFSGVVEPPPELGPLIEAHRIAQVCAPDGLRAHRAELISRLDRQLGPV